MLKKIQVVMLPTEKAQTNSLLLGINRNILYLATENSSSFVNRKEADGTIKPQHLYFLSDEETKNNDWFYDYHTKKVLKYLSNKSGILNEIYSNYKKVVATTDKSLKQEIFGLGETAMCSLPQPSKSFIEKYISEYNKGNIIKYVDVEYFNDWIGKEYVDEQDAYGYDKFELKLKVDRNNEIAIHAIKNSWSREELSELKSAFEESTHYTRSNDYREQCVQRIFKWIKENL